MVPRIGVALPDGAGAIFGVIQMTMGLRVTDEEEIEGLDLGEHGMHAYDLHTSGTSLDEPLSLGRPLARAAAASEFASDRG